MPERNRLTQLYETMLRIRLFEERVAQDFRDGRLPGIVHLSIGQEAVAAGVAVNLRADDYVFSTHRAHGHFLAKGAPIREMMAEIWGRKTGLCGGKGGSMHLADVANGILGANAIVGGGQPLAAGAAMAIRYRKTDQIVATYFGDGAVTSGGFHEGAVMAATFSLPILYVGENNGYSETAGASFHLRGGTIVDALRGYGFESRSVDGMDAEAISEAARELTELIRRDQRPALLECLTYRYHGHFEGDPMSYRTEAEVATWRARDPISLAHARLLERGTSADELERIRLRVDAEVDAAAAYAAESSWPNPSATLEGVYA